MASKILLIINGTCGSGKTTVATLLSQQYGIPYIDVDFTIKSIKDQTSLTPAYNSIEVYNKLMDELQNIKSKVVVIASIFLSKDFIVLKSLISYLDFNMFHILLKPDFETAICRTQERTCFKNKTPVEVTKYFHEEIQKSFRNENIDLVIDNSNQFMKMTTNLVWEHIGRITQDDI